MNELYADVYYKIYGLETIGLRYFNIYGKKQDPNGTHTVGERVNLLEMTSLIKKYLSEYKQEISHVEIIHGPERLGDIPHSHASIEKAKNILGYKPTHDLKSGLKEAIDWYWRNLKQIE